MARIAMDRPHVAPAIASGFGLNARGRYFASDTTQNSVGREDLAPYSRSALRSALLLAAVLA